MQDVILVVRMTPVPALYAGFYDRISKALGASRILAAGMAPRVETSHFAVEVGLSSILTQCLVAGIFAIQLPRWILYITRNLLKRPV